jgi:glycosyltransferase-like protein LARGE
MSLNSAYCYCPAGITAEQHPLLDPSTPYEPSYDQLYPINALRNVALSQAATPLVLCADGDFVFSEGLQDMLLQPWAAQLLQLDSLEQQQQQPVMLVLPVFQLALQHELPDSKPAALPRNKQQLAQALAAGRVEPFHCGAFPPQRQPIDVDVWLAAGADGCSTHQAAATHAPEEAAGSSAEEKAAAAVAYAYAYEVGYCEYFEPQGVAVKQQLPLYDECFRGYGLNKVQHAWHCAQLGYSFKVCDGCGLQQECQNVSCAEGVGNAVHRRYWDNQVAASLYTPCKTAP